MSTPANNPFSPENVEITPIPKFKASLLQGDQVVATGQAEVSEGEITFYPVSLTPLESVLRAPISLKATDSGALTPLSHSQELLDESTAHMWFFEDARLDKSKED